MATLEDYRESSFVTYCTRALETFAAETPGVKNVILATPDGFEIAAHADSSKHSADSLAAVGSSLFALGSSLIGEFELGATRSITIDSDWRRSSITGRKQRCWSSCRYSGNGGGRRLSRKVARSP